MPALAGTGLRNQGGSSEHSHHKRRYPLLPTLRRAVMPLLFWWPYIMWMGQLKLMAEGAHAPLRAP